MIRLRCTYGFRLFGGWLLGTALLAGCGGGGNTKPKGEYDTPTKGTIRISVDESFRPVIDSQIKVYQASYPNTQIIAEYKPEAECLKDLESDSTRMVIVTRGLTREESKQFQTNINFRPSWGLIAYDAVAIVCNNKSKDTIFTMQDIRSMLKGTSGYKYKVVMDGTSATSTVRFAIDSILNGEALGPNVVAANSSEGVIDYVSKNEDAIGMVGVSWVGDLDDDKQLSFLKKVKIASVQCSKCEGSPYTQPFQANIALGRYPLIRGIFYILKENYEGLGRGFTNFLIYERGQLIFQRAYLLPGRMNFEVRSMQVTE